MSTTITLSICTFNIHSFKTANNKYNIKELTSFLNEKQYDIICFNEATSDYKTKTPFQTILKTLNKNNKKYNYVYGRTNNGYEGNAIITHLPIKRFENKYIGKAGKIGRNILGIEMEHSHLPYCFLTHFDHVRENVRLEQAQRAVDFIKDFMNKSITTTTTTQKNFVFLGDFNSMVKTDYTEAFWKYLIKQRIQFGWELPETKVTDYLFNNNKEVNTKEVYNNNELLLDNDKNTSLSTTTLTTTTVTTTLPIKLIDCWKECNKEEKFIGQKYKATSRLNTRIDYITCNEECIKYLDYCQIVNQPNEVLFISDHLPVEAHFTFTI
ncbi:hypothetical protein ABK040_005853 [Willaertia magna]